MIGIRLICMTCVVFWPALHYCVKKQQISKIYTLHGQRDTAPSYLVGSKCLRNAIQVDQRKSIQRLEKARREHRDLESLLSVSFTAGDSEVAEIKKKKLRLKDEIVKLLRKLALDLNKPKPSDLVIELGVGGFGKILFGHAVDTDQEVAVKVAATDDYSSLWKEYLILQRLQYFEGFPRTHFFGKQDVLGLGKHVVMVMDVLGPSIERLFFATYLGTNGFSSMTVLMLALQIINRLEVLSLINIVHGDIQPGNFLMGKGNRPSNATVYLIDFGISQLSYDTTNMQNTVDIEKMNHIKNAGINEEKLFRGAFQSKVSTTEKLSGTLVFSSIAAMKNEKINGLDDVESLCYSLAYLLCNALPWTNLPNPLSESSSGFTTTTTNLHTNHGDDEYDKLLIQKVLNVKENCTPINLIHDKLKLNTNGAEMIIQLYSYIRSCQETNKQNLVIQKLDFKYMKDLINNFIKEEKLLLYNQQSTNHIKSKSMYCNDGNVNLFDWELKGIRWDSDGSLTVDDDF